MGAANRSYVGAYEFLEKVRISSGQPKSAKRVKSEREYGPHGRSLRHDDGKRWVFNFR